MTECRHSAEQRASVAKLDLKLPGRYESWPSLRIAPLRDPRMRERYGSGWRDFLRLDSPEAVHHDCVFLQEHHLPTKEHILAALGWAERAREKRKLARLGRRGRESMDMSTGKNRKK